MSDDSEVQTISNLINSRKVVIHQGENAFNIINIYGKPDNKGGSSKPDGKTTRPTTFRNQQDTKAVASDGKQHSKKDMEEDSEDPGEKVIPTDKVKEAMEEIAAIQLCDQSQLRTLIFILDNQVKLQDQDGFLATRQKIHDQIQTLGPDEPFFLAAEYMERGKEFEALMLCKHLITWIKGHIDKVGGAQSCIKQMTTVYMSLARDAAWQLARSISEANEIYKPYLVPLMYEMLAEIEEVKCDDERFKACFEALGSYYVACIHFTLEDWQETYGVCNNAIIKMQDVCPSAAEKHLVYADLLFMAAMAKYRMDELRDAEELSKKAIKAFEEEGNTNSNSEKNNSVKIVESWLGLIREKLSDVSHESKEEIST